MQITKILYNSSWVGLSSSMKYWTLIYHISLRNKVVLKFREHIIVNLIRYTGVIFENFKYSVQFLSHGVYNISFNLAIFIRQFRSTSVYRSNHSFHIAQSSGTNENFLGGWDFAILTQIIWYWPERFWCVPFGSQIHNTWFTVHSLLRAIYGSLLGRHARLPLANISKMYHTIVSREDIPVLMPCHQMWLMNTHNKLKVWR